MKRKLYTVLLSEREREHLRDVAMALERSPAEVIRIALGYLSDRLAADGLPAQDLMQYLADRARSRAGSWAVKEGP